MSDVIEQVEFVTTPRVERLMTEKIQPTFCEAFGAKKFRSFMP